MIAEGAALVDIGGESTRPGSDGSRSTRSCAASFRCSRRSRGEVPVSIDTAKAEVARRALELGAEMVNDVTALRGDPGLADVVAEHGAYVCLMHMQGEPRTMQVDPRYDDVAAEVAAFLEERLAFAVAQGVRGGAHLPRPRHRLRQDDRAQPRAAAPPRRAARARPARPDRLLAQELARQARRRPGRDDRPAGASVAAAVAAYERGATILRVHDVREHVEALAVARGARMTSPSSCAALRLFGRHGVHAHEKEHGQEFVFDVDARRRRARRCPTGSRTRSTTATSRAPCRRSPTRASYDLLEALATAVADELLRALRRRARASCASRSRRCKPGGLDGTAGVSVSRP